MLKKSAKIVTGVVLLIAYLALAGIASTRYTRTGTVYAIDGSEVIVEDTCGYLWVCEADGFKVGQEVKLLMTNNSTDTIKDDEVLNIK